MKRLAAALLATALAGCAGPRPPTPSAAAVQAPGQWRTTPDRAAALDADWWAAFGDPVLSQVVETALAHNTDIAIAAGRVEEARSAYDLAQAQRLPNLVAAAAGARTRDVSPFGMPRLQTQGQAQLSVAYDTDLFGRLRQASAAARANLLATEAGRDSVRLAVAASAAAGYINLRALDDRLVVLQRTLEARAGALKLAQRRADAGYAPRLDEAQALSDYRLAEALIPPTQAAIARQENGLSVLLGDNPRAIARGRDLAELTAPPLAAGLPAELLRRRPDLAQAEQQLVATDRTLDSVRAAFLPNVQLTAGGGYVASNLLDDPIRVFSLGGSVLDPLLDFGRLKAQQSAAAARRDQAAFAYRRAALTAFREVDDALATERGAAAQTEDLIAQREAQARVLTLASNRYRAGYSPFLEQLEAQRTLLAVELGLVYARADRLIAVVSLFQALGGGWTAPR